VTSRPTIAPTPGFKPGSVRTEPDGRMYFPVYDRNVGPILTALEPLLAGKTGRALEIGSGTGQHVVDFARAFPGLVWHPSDPESAHRVSIDAWRAHAGAQTAPALDLDAASDWAARGEIAALAPLALILSLNVIHISPIAVLHGILAGAAATLEPGGMLAFYGPFREGGAHTGDGNAAFDADLRARNAAWGIRDVGEIVATAQPLGLTFVQLITMPANNRILVLRRD
jgi:hypothetical protein